LNDHLQSCEKIGPVVAAGKHQIWSDHFKRIAAVSLGGATLPDSKIDADRINSVCSMFDLSPEVKLAWSLLKVGLGKSIWRSIGSGCCS
jgi:hypothetical protein